MTITAAAIASRSRMAIKKLDEKARIVYFSESNYNFQVSVLFSSECMPDIGEIILSLAEHIPELIFTVHYAKITEQSGKLVAIDFRISQYALSSRESYMSLTPPENKPEPEVQSEQAKLQRKARKGVAV